MFAGFFVVWCFLLLSDGFLLCDWYCIALIFIYLCCFAGCYCFTFVCFVLLVLIV